MHAGVIQRDNKTLMVMQNNDIGYDITWKVPVRLNINKTGIVHKWWVHVMRDDQLVLRYE